MLILASILAAAGLVMAAIAVRGRVVARGRFCRGCKFDLAGLSSFATCPECGRDLHGVGSTRAALRRARRAYVLLAAMLLVLSATCFLLASPVVSGRVVASLPDGALIRLARLGFAGPLDELVDRTGGAKPMTDGGWDRAISTAITQFSDRSAPTDPRWATVLYNALQSGRLTAEQAAQYVTAGLDFRARIRDRTQHGSGVLAFRIEQDSGRMAALLPTIDGSMTSYRVRYEPVAAGWVRADGEGAVVHDLRPLSMPIWIPTVGTRGTSTRIVLGPQVRLDAPWDELRPGQFATAFLEYDIGLILSSDTEAIPLGRRRFEQRVRIIEADEPVVAVIDDEAVRAMFRERMRASVLKVMLPSGDPDQPQPRGANHVAYMMFSGADIPRGIAGRVSVRIEEDEWHLGDLVSGAVWGLPPGSGGMHVVAWLAQPEEMDRASEIVGRWLAAGTVDLVFRTDPAVAIGAVAVNEVHQADLVWEDVEVRLVGQPSRGMMFSSADREVPASPEPPPLPAAPVSP